MGLPTTDAAFPDPALAPGGPLEPSWDTRNATFVPTTRADDDTRGARPNGIEHRRTFPSEEYRGSGRSDYAAALPGATDLLNALQRRGLVVAPASSADQEGSGRYLRLRDGGRAADAIGTGAKAAARKPNPGVFTKAREQWGESAHALAIGDTVAAIKMAGKLGRLPRAAF
ncbi:MAG: HAD family hydrolase [Chloroflexota bacterium]